MIFSYRLLHMDTQVLADQLKLTFISTVDTECCLEDLSRVMTDRNKWQENIKEICNVSTTS